jgi:hypothetical protein
MEVHITAVTKEVLQEDNSNFLSVQFDILDDGVVVETRRLGFPFDAEPDHIKEECKKVADALQADRDLAERNKVQEELHAKADETINQLITNE